MKRPLGCACLLFVLFIRLFYICFPPSIPDYGAWKGSMVYVSGRVASVKQQERNGEMQTVFILQDISDLHIKDKSGTYTQGKTDSYVQNKSDANMSEKTDSNTQDKSDSNTKDEAYVPYAHDKIYCYTKNMKLNIGERVWVRGSLQPYEAAANPGQFDARFYYHVQGIGACLYDAELVWQDGGASMPGHLLDSVKAHFLQKLEACFSEKYGGVMKTILLGDKTGLDEGLKQLFKEGGILHILTISGMHISMLGMGSFRLLRRLKIPQKPAAVAGLCIVLIYGMMIGTQAATFRAICMFALQMAAILSGRTYDSLTGLSLAAILLLLEEPMYVFYSGFLLSFGAVAGITVVSPVIERYAAGSANRAVKKLGRLFSGGIGILAVTLPIQLYFYCEYPLYSMLINVMVLPFLPYIVGLGAALLAIPAGLSILTAPLALLCQLLLAGYEQLCLLSQRLPGHALVLGAPTAWQFAVHYICLFICLYLLQRHDGATSAGVGQRYAQAVCCTFLMLFAVFLLLWRPVKGMTCHFLSVGQGDCAIIQCGKEAYVVDCGSTSEGRVAEEILLPCLKYFGISKVAGVFISHADADHMNGILQWLEEYEHSHVKIERILLPALSEEALEEEFGRLLTLAALWEIPVSEVGAGDAFSVGKLDIRVLHPQKETADTEDANAYSQVLLFRYGEHGLFMTGDIAAEQEATLLTQKYLSETTILKAAHHGSRYSNSETFLQAVQPKHVVLSYGVGNSYGHPHAETVERLQETGAALWYTGRQGAITAVFDKYVTVRSMW